MKTLSLTVVAICVLASPALAQPPLPACFAEAVTIGQHMKGTGTIALGSLGGGLTSISTPFSRIVAAAAEAKSKLLPFAVTDTAPGRPVALVVAGPVLFSTDKHFSVEHVAIRTIDSTDPAEIIQPVVSKPFAWSGSNAFGASITEQGVTAEFPLDALRLGRELYIVVRDRQPVRHKIEKKLLDQLRPDCHADDGGA